MAHAEPTAAETFSVMTFNLRFGLAQDGANAWRFRKKILPRLFAAHPADFIGFQEVNRFQADDLNRMLPEYGSVGKREPAPEFWQNNIIYYRNDWELTGYRHFYLSPTPSIPSRARESRWPRQCTIGMFRKQERRLTCINTHFDFKASVQEESAAIIMDRLQQMSRPSPAVLMGDFNAPPESPHFKIFTRAGLPKEAGSLFFKSALKKSCGGTHHGFSGQTDGDCIDWILFAGNAMRRLDCRIIRDHVNGAYYSDHFPVLATFAWQD